MSDIVYVASPHETHYGYIQKALQKDKHVISEKPMVLKKAEAEKLCRLAEERNLILLEGIKTLYCPGYQMVLKLVAGGTIGTLCNVEACFTKLEKRHTRELMIRYMVEALQNWGVMDYFRFCSCWEIIPQR